MPTKTQQPISVSAGAGTAPTAVQPAEAKKTKGGEAFTLNTSSKDPKSVTKAKESISKRMSTKKGGATGAKKSAAKSKLGAASANVKKQVKKASDSVAAAAKSVTGKGGKTTGKVTGTKRSAAPPAAAPSAPAGGRLSKRARKAPSGFEP